MILVLDRDKRSYYNSLKAQSSIYIDKGGHYIVDGHHTTVANTMLGRGTEILI